MVIYCLENLLLIGSLVGCAVLLYYMIDALEDLVEGSLSETEKTAATETQKCHEKAGTAAAAEKQKRHEKAGTAAAAEKKGKKHGYGTVRGSKHTRLHFGFSK